jgi:hypothetical protein
VIVEKLTISGFKSFFDRVELNLGPDPQVVFELLKLRVWRDNIWMQIRGGNVYRRVEDGAAAIEINSAVAGWDAHELYAQRIRNYTAKPIDVEIRRGFPGHILFRSALDPILHDYQTVQLQTTVQPAAKADLLFEILKHEGYNAKQNNVTLERADVKR